MKILMFNAEVVNDLGGPSIVAAFCDITRANSNGDDVVIDLLTSKASDKTEKYLEKLQVGCFKYGNLFSKKNIFKVFRHIKNINKQTTPPIDDFVYENLKKLSTYDCLVDMGGICFTDNIPQRNLVRTVYEKMSWIVAKKLGLKVILYTTSIGPIRTLKTKWGSKFLMERYCDYIMFRERECEKIYNKLKISTPYIVCPDTAFCFKEEKPTDANWEKFSQNTKKIGISLSFQLMRQTEGYFDVMLEVCHYLVDNKYNIVLIANECSGFEESDDRYVVNMMKEQLNSPLVYVVNTVDMSGENLKWIISKCDVVIASRYHTLIAAISTNVPSVALSWHFKYKEALNHVGLGENIVENTDFTAESIIEKFNATYEHRYELKESMREKVERTKKSVIDANAEFCKQIYGN